MEIITRKEAMERGLNKYFTGNPCKYGHIEERYTISKGCTRCAYDRGKRWAQENPEMARASSIKWKEKNKEKIKKMTRERYAKNRDKRIKYAKEYRLNNPEKSRASVAKWREANKDKIKLWNERNPESHKKAKKKWNSKNKDRVCLYSSNRRAKSKESDSTHTAQDIVDLYSAQKGRCAYCKMKVGNKYHVDHIQPLSKGGGNGKDNLQICCPACNLKKHAKDPIDFAKELGFLI